VPIRTVLLTSLTKDDGRKHRVLRAREFHQIAGRAGRAGFDSVGYVVVQAPEHVVLNAKALAKAGDDAKKRRKVVHKKAPEGTLTYTESTDERLVMAPPEPLVSKMRVNHAMVLNVLDQWEGQQAALNTLLLDNHEEPARRDALVERAVQVLTSLLRAGLVEPDDGSSLTDWLPVEVEATTSDDVAPEPLPRLLPDVVADEGDLGPIGELLAAAGHLTPTPAGEDSTWPAFRNSVTAGLSASACGILYWGWDLAGFSGPVPDAELYLRAAWASAFMPVMQYHAEFNHHREPKRDRTPWWVAEVNDAPFVVDEFRAAVEERELLVPYLAAAAREAIGAGEPLMRALAFDWPADPAMWDFATQWMLASEFLVCPVLAPGAETLDVYLPDPGAGREWRDRWTGEAMTPGRHAVDVRTDGPRGWRCPVFRRTPAE
jgi:hypothetical protein